MREKRARIMFYGKEYGLLYNIVAMDEVTKRYGGIGELHGLMESEPSRFEVEELPWLMALLINQNIALSNFEDGTDIKPVAARWIQLRIEPYMRASCARAVVTAINRGNEGPQPDEDEEVDEVLEELAKNVQGAGELPKWKRLLCALCLWVCRLGLQKNKPG